jgi:dihydropteroate synthase
MAYPPAAKKVANALAEIKRLLRESLAKTVGRISANKIVIDPGIGFFREQGMPWWKWDAVVLRNLYQLKTLKRPLLIGVSRKSFIGNLTGEKAPEKRLYGSLAATALAIQNGARLIRTHDVLATKEAIKVTEGILSFGTK